MVADLLQLGDGGENGALLGLRRAGAGTGDEFVEHGLVQTDLLGRHRAVVELVDVVGELLGDERLGLRAPEHQHAVQSAQGGLSVA